ncbi:MAG TPA: NADH-quinone oxidoreductase subunit B family protein [Candidatus Ozemobacteraceae bacterium]|nr:NADH-quinone oxidoreductase subunit B family protein [Candidatus Ozemobacteraceae bacterium]
MVLGCIDRSPWIVHYNCNSCNGCDIELLACLTPLYDLERFGVLHVGNPKHADILVVTGSVNHRNARVLKNVYDQMPGPKMVVAMGACSATGGIFADCYNVLGGIEKVVPVDVWIPGCPPKPEAIIDGMVKAVGIWKSNPAFQAQGGAARISLTRRPPAAPVQPAAAPQPQQQPQPKEGSPDGRQSS